MNRLTLRARITVLFVLTVLFSGIALIGSVYAYLRFTPVPFQAVLGAVETGDSSAVIDAAVPITDEILRVMLTISLTVLALLTGIAGVAGWFVAGVVIQPLREIAGTAREVTSGELTTRVVYRGPEDEVFELAHALNAMLDSLAASIAAQRRFTANASHELKTPIATIQTMADVALANPAAQAAELRGTLERVREVNAANAATVTSLLHLADLQAGRPLTMQSVNLSELCERVAAAHRIACVDIAAGINVRGEAELLRQAIDNLARNTALHGRPGTGTMHLTVGDNQQAVLTVSNDGPVLSAEELEQLAEPFARAREGTGNGIGLPLTRAITTAHGGALVLKARASGGIEARVTLPLVDAS